MTRVINVNDAREISGLEAYSGRLSLPAPQGIRRDVNVCLKLIFLVLMIFFIKLRIKD